jgi:molybdenum cofactor cytidylyltransferase
VEFGPVATREAEGAVLAHSISLGNRKLKKGRRLAAEDITTLTAAGLDEVIVARPGPGDLGEDEAAALIAQALAASGGFTVSEAFTGRVNVFAAAAGVLRVKRSAVDALNAVDPAITLATLPDFARVEACQMVATAKIIPYAVAGDLVAQATKALGHHAFGLHPFRAGRAELVLTRTQGMKESLLSKGARVIEARLAALGWTMAPAVTVAHETEAVAKAIAGAEGEMVLILGASATSDAADVCPAGLVAAGGTLDRFGMPVDPGNLLFLGHHRARPVLGLPGCARSPALNGADWVLERLAAGIAVSGADIAAMGVGGLLKEIPIRPQPRSGKVQTPARPRVAAIVLAAGAGRRMRGADKLLEPVAGRPILRSVAEAARASRATEVVAVIPPGNTARRQALEDTRTRIVEAVECAEGMAGSLRAGVAALGDTADAVVILLADMPEVAASDIDRLIAAFDPVEGREICRAVTETGKPGHPVLFGRRFFESLMALRGDRGARDVVRSAPEFIADVPTSGEGAVIDLDTPEAWTSWRDAAPSDIS